ncbi:MAG: hypothetical protein KAF40_03350 [Flavihumibacter sp.]|nr:hypothetical protein [Flavihumibacter sp.]
MARTIAQINDEILSAVQADVVLGPLLTSTSATALFGLFSYIVASAIWTVEKLQDTFKLEVLDIISRLKPHTRKWYVEKALAFQYGFNLLPDSDLFDNTGYTTDQINDSKVVDYAAVVIQENPFGRRFLRMKLATTVGTDLGPLDAGVLVAIRSYFDRVADAGVKLQIESLPADSLKQRWKIYYDPLILTNTGGRVDGSSSDPVGDAIRGYLKNLPFNGTFVPTYHIDAVQQVEGVVIPQMLECFATYGALPYNTVAEKYEPDAGYLRFIDPTDLVIEYEPLNAIEQ